jgi:hypothetical protein
MASNASCFEDPLHNGTMEMSHYDVPPLTSGDAIFAELERRVTTKENLDGILNAPSNRQGFRMAGVVEIIEIC